MLNIRRGSLAQRLLQVPLAHTHDRSRAETSRLTWGEHGTDCYALTPLSLLHSVTGFTVYLWEK